MNSGKTYFDMEIGESITYDASLYEPHSIDQEFSEAMWKSKLELPPPLRAFLIEVLSIERW